MYSLPSHRDHLKMTSLLISLRETVFLTFRVSNAVIVVVDVVDVVIVVVVLCVWFYRQLTVFTLASVCGRGNCKSKCYQEHSVI